MQADWQPVKMGVLPKQLNDALKGSVPWKGNVAIELPYHGSATYKVGITGDLQNVSSNLPSPANKTAGQALPLKIDVDGNLRSFDLTGNVGQSNHINSRWLLGNKLALQSAIWTSDSRTIPPLPQAPGVELNLPPMDGAQWLALFQRGAADSVSSAASFPESVTLRTPSLAFAGQQWNNLSLVSKQTADGTRVEAQGREINASLTMKNNSPWQAAVRYLYYNPSANPLAQTASSGSANATASSSAIDFHGWPDLQLRCAECWLWGRNTGELTVISASKAIRSRWQMAWWIPVLAA